MQFTRHPLCAKGTLQGLGNVPLDQALIRRLRASCQQLTAHGPGLAQRFLARLRAQHPALRASIVRDRMKLEAAFLDTLRLAVDWLDDTDRVHELLRDVGRRMAIAGVPRDELGAVGHILLCSLAEQAGSAWTADAADDWKQTVRLAAEIVRTAWPQEPG